MKWERMSWSEKAAQGLALSLGDDAEIIREEIVSGQSDLWLVNGCTWLVLRLECYAVAQDELVMVAIEGQQSAAVVEAVKKYAKKIGVGAVRFHSSRKGAARFVKALGFEQIETVFKYEV